MNDEPPILELNDVAVEYAIKRGWLDSIRRHPAGAVRALDGVSLSVKAGEILAVAGESGSGKTTLGRVIVKLAQASRGTMTFEGEEVSTLRRGRRMRAFRSRVQLIFQDPYETLNPRQTVRDFVLEPLRVNRIGTRAEREQKVIDALDASGLSPAEHFLYRYPHELSGGQRQRVVIAGAMVMDPRLVVADEPVSMLDVSVRTGILKLMLDLRDSRDLSYVFITHDLALAWAIADRIAVFYLGKVVEIGSSQAVIESPIHPYTQALVSVSPSPIPPTAGQRAARVILSGESPDASHVPSGCRFHPRCPLAMDRCRSEEPPLLPRSSGHLAACWIESPDAASAPAVPSHGAAHEAFRSTRGLEQPEAAGRS